MPPKPFSLSYAGATAEADNYDGPAALQDHFVIPGREGHYVELDEVGSTAYKTATTTLGVAIRRRHLVEAKFGYQEMPYQLYPNQRMDMLDNEQQRLNLRYRGQFGWGTLDARAYARRSTTSWTSAPTSASGTAP
jgi:iron complex outermembrane receptor protein